MRRQLVRIEGPQNQTPITTTNAITKRHRSPISHRCIVTYHDAVTPLSGSRFSDEHNHIYTYEYIYIDRLGLAMEIMILARIRRSLRAILPISSSASSPVSPTPPESGGFREFPANFTFPSHRKEVWIRPDFCIPFSHVLLIVGGCHEPTNGKVSQDR